jgi:predicted nucleotidyltransferase component of viral defense system
MRNVTDAILLQLRQVARDRNQTTQDILVRWAVERFLARLSQSELSDRLVLKGGYLFTLWFGDFLRSTHDLDLHASGEDQANARDLLVSVASECTSVEDGVVFETERAVFQVLKGSRLPGLRMKLPTRVGSARPILKVDVGFAHPINPGVDVRWYPSLIPGFGSDQILAYPRETVIAEKLATAVEFGRDNTRLRDYYDVWYLTRRHSFQSHVLRLAIQQTFACRDASKTLPRTDGYWEAAFNKDYVTNFAARNWGKWLRLHSPVVQPPPLEAMIADVAMFALPLLCAIRDDTRFDHLWRPSEGWLPSHIPSG